MNKKWINILLIAAAVALGVYCWLVLPATVAVQVGLDGQATNTMPKLLAVAIPAGLSVAGSVMSLTGRSSKSRAGYVLALVGIAVMILTLFFNR